MKTFFVTVVTLFTFTAFAQSPALGDRADFESAVRCTQSNIRPHLNQFIEQAQPVIEEIENYLQQYRRVCSDGARPDIDSIKPIVDSLQLLSTLFSQYNETYRSKKEAISSREELRSLLTSNRSDFSLKGLYRARSIHWDYIWGLSVEDRQLGIDMFQGKQEEAEAAWGAIDSVYAKLFYHNDFNSLDIHLLNRVMQILPAETRCLAVSERFLATIETRVIPNWRVIAAAASSPVIVGEFGKVKQCN